MSLVSLTSLVYCFHVRPGAYLRKDHLKGASLREAPALLAKTRLVWKGLLGTNTLALIQTFVNYNCRKFYNMGPWGDFASAATKNLGLTTKYKLAPKWQLWQKQFV